ncbi:phosphatidate phosphatase LPIN2-like isoform X2 [Physella acuta]|uniref:phosphatidate phosphatase LPIN2-like isoform X2 n=1 Tax=Physella acuta TaxID=109671 RepID=UPI0027DDBA83|nr:phosphatidate phosphatase LPIN2-like isoform X2 [Physella acuta]
MSFSLVGRLFQNLKGFYNGINPATLTGAIDVVIVKQPDGSYHSSPFHVRFGKLGVLRSREKVVDIEVNGEPTDLQMKLGEAGEAFFVQEIESEEEDIPAYLATSPLPSSMQLMEKGLEDLHKQAEAAPGCTAEQMKEAGEEQQLALKIRDPRSDSSWDEPKVSSKPRRKVLKKKKQKSSANRQSPRSMSMPENVTEEVIFDLEVTGSSDEDEVQKTAYGARSSSSPDFKDMDMLQGTTSYRRINSFGSGSFVTPFSEPETSPVGSPIGTRPSTPKSDTEVDKQHTEESQTSALMETSATWQWGEFPTNVETTPTRTDKTILEPKVKTTSGFMSIWSKPAPSKKPEGIYLDELASMDDPEMAKIYLGRTNVKENEDDTESGRGQSLPQSPNSVEGAIGGPVSFTMSELRHLGPVALSLCGGLNDAEPITLDKFMQKVVTFEDLAESPNITSNPDLVVKIHDKYYNWATASPMVLSQIVFHKQLPEPAIKGLEKEHMPKKKKKKGWFSWGRSAEVEADIEPGQRGSDTASSTATSPGTESVTPKDAANSPAQSPTPTPPASNSGTPRKRTENIVRLQQEENTSTETDTDASEKDASKPSSPHPETLNVPQTLNVPTAMTVLQAHQASQQDTDPDSRRRHPSSASEAGGTKTKKEKYIKTLRLSSEQILKMKLREGHNEISFSVTTQYQGTTRCVSHVYLWSYDDKIVISDIDGTITKSDALGQILPMIGRDWSQSGVAQLFTRIQNNGYKLIYLSARAIGQSRSTKDMLKNIKQGDLVLPDGPLFLNPTSLFSAFHREVILKNPEEFKISCLKDIADLFPSSPFYAGFGNKLNDVIAYRALDIPNFRIFTINPQGQLRHDLSLTFLSSYSGMSDIVDHFFPSLNQVDRGTSVEYNPVNYWKFPIPELTPEELAQLCTTSQAPVEAEKK